MPLSNFACNIHDDDSAIPNSGGRRLERATHPPRNGGGQNPGVVAFLWWWHDIHDGGPLILLHRLHYMACIWLGTPFPHRVIVVAAFLLLRRIWWLHHLVIRWPPRGHEGGPPLETVWTGHKSEVAVVFGNSTMGSREEGLREDGERFGGGWIGRMEGGEEV